MSSSPFRVNSTPFLTYNNKRGGLSPNSMNMGGKKNTSSPSTPSPSMKPIHQQPKIKPPSPAILNENNDADKVVSLEKKREMAEDLLRRSDTRQQTRLKEKLETHIDKDIRLMREESEKLSDARFKTLSQHEQGHVESVKKVFGDLEKVYYERSQRKNRVLNQLFYLKAKQLMNKIAFESNIEENITSTNEITEIAKQKTREWMTNLVEENRPSLKGDFFYKFESFTRITRDQELQELKDSIFSYVSPVVEEKKRDSHIALTNHYNSINACKERMFTAFSRNIKNKFETQFEDRYNEKVQQISLGKEAVQLTPDEIIEFLEADIDDYETDIGVIDAEIDRINNEINDCKEKIEMKREYHEKQKASIQSQIDLVNQSNQVLLNSINRLKKQQQSVKIIDTKFLESIGGTLLSELIEKTQRIIKQDVPRLKQLSAGTVTEIQSLQRAITEKETEFDSLTDKMKSEDESMNALSKRLSILGVRLYQHEKTIKHLEETKLKSYSECENIRAKLLTLRQEVPKKQVRLMAHEQAFEEMTKSVELNCKILSQDLAKYKENNDMIMEFLKERRTRLKELCDNNQSKLRKLIKYSGSLNSACSSDTQLEHCIVTLHQEELDKAMEQFDETLQMRTKESVEQLKIAENFNDRAREGAMIYKFASNLFEQDLARFETGVDDPKMDEEKMHNLVHRQFAKKIRLILLLNFLLEITGLGQEYILTEGFLPSNSSMLDVISNKNYFDHNGLSVCDTPKLKNENAFLDNKIYGEINTIFINAIENQTVADKHDVMSRIDNLQEIICKKEGVNMNELEQKLKNKLVLVQIEKERTAGLQKELERIEKKNLETSNTTEGQVRRRLNSLTMDSIDDSTILVGDEETNRIVAEERQTRKRHSSFSPSSLISKIESAKSNNQN